MDEEVFAVAFVKVFIIISPGKMKRVYGTPCISDILCSNVNPNIAMYSAEVIIPRNNYFGTVHSNIWIYIRAEDIRNTGCPIHSFHFTWADYDEYLNERNCKYFFIHAPNETLTTATRSFNCTLV